MMDVIEKEQESVPACFEKGNLYCSEMILGYVEERLGWQITEGVRALAVGILEGCREERCGLLTAALLVIHLYLHEKGVDECEEVRLCYGFGKCFEKRFDAEGGCNNGKFNLQDCERKRSEICTLIREYLTECGFELRGDGRKNDVDLSGM